MMKMTVPMMRVLAMEECYDLPLFICVTILFPHHSILLITHSRRTLTWRGSSHFLNTAYLLVRSLSTFSLVDLSSDILIS